MALFAKRVLAVFLICCVASTNYLKTNPTLSEAKGDPTKGIHVQYGSLSCQEYYYYLPENLSGVKNIVFMIHGGAWSTGGCSQFSEQAVAAAKSGYISVSMDHRKIQNGANAFDMVKDIADAVSSLKKQLNSKNIRFDKMAVAGWSSGAHLALLYAYEYYFNRSPIPIAFMCVCAAPTDFLDDAYSGRTFMGQMANSLMTSLSGEVILPGTEASHMNAIKKISPVNLVKKGVPPTIVVNGDDDDVVPPSNSEKLYNELRKNGVDTVRIVYKGAGHFLGSQFPEEKVRTQVFMQFADKYF